MGNFPGTTGFVAPSSILSASNTSSTTNPTANNSGLSNSGLAPAGTVTVYTATGKGGSSHAFTSSQSLSTLDPSQLGGVGSNNIQSLVVGAGATLTLYNETNLKGTYILAVQGPSYIEDLNEIDFGRNTAQSLSVNIPSSPPPTLVTMYSYNNFDPTHTYVSINQYGSYSDLNNIGFPDSDIASMQVAPGTVATIYANRGFGTYSGPPVTVPTNSSSTAGAQIPNMSTITWTESKTVGSAKNFYNQGDSIVVKPVVTPTVGQTISALIQQTNPVNTYHRAGATSCDGNDWFQTTYAGGVVCSGPDPNGCPVIGGNNGSPTWPPGTANASSTASTTLGGGPVPPPYAQLLCTYNVSDFSTAQDIQVMLDPNSVQNPAYPGQTYPSWVDPTAVQTLMDETPDGVLATICNRRSSACPPGLLNPTTNLPATSCSQMIATDTLGQQCQAWIARVGAQANGTMTTYCDSNTTYDCACITPQNLPYWSSIFGSLQSLTSTSIPNQGNRGCFFLPCTNPTEYLVPTTYLTPSACPVNCIDLFQFWGNVDSNISLGSIQSTFNCSSTTTTGPTGATGPVVTGIIGTTGSTGIAGPVGSGPAIGPVGSSTTPAATTTPTTSSPTSSSKKWLYIILGVIGAILLIAIILIIVYALRKPKPPP